MILGLWFLCWHGVEAGVEAGQPDLQVVQLRWTQRKGSGSDPLISSIKIIRQKMKEKIEFSSRLDCLFVYLCDVKLKWRYDQHLNKYLKKESQERGRKQKEQYCTMWCQEILSYSLTRLWPLPHPIGQCRVEHRQYCTQCKYMRHCLPLFIIRLARVDWWPKGGGGGVHVAWDHR